MGAVSSESKGGEKEEEEGRFLMATETSSFLDRAIFPLQWMLLFTIAGLGASTYVLYEVPKLPAFILYPVCERYHAIAILLSPVILILVPGCLHLVAIIGDDEIENHSLNSKLAIDAYQVLRAACAFSMHLIWLNYIMFLQFSFSSTLAIVSLWYMVRASTLGLVERNRCIGIRSKWSRSSEELWSRTQEFAACIQAGFGFAGFVSSFGNPSYMVSDPTMGLQLVLALLIVSIIIPHVYSFVIYRQHQRSVAEVAKPLLSG